MNEFAPGLPMGVSFIVKNITSSPGRIIKAFQTQIYPGQSLDVMKIPGVGEDDLRESLLKGDLGNKIKNGQLQVVSTTIVITDSDPTFVAFLQAAGFNANIVNNTTGGGGGSAILTSTTRNPPTQGGLPINLSTGGVFVLVTCPPIAVAAGQKLIVWYSSEWQTQGAGIDDVSWFIAIDGADPGTDIVTANSYGQIPGGGQFFRDVVSWNQEFSGLSVGNHVVTLLAQSDNGGSLSQINASRVQLMVL
jgi:hypothetical protein